jgi:hypothetical protein
MAWKAPESGICLSQPHSNVAMLVNQYLNAHLLSYIVLYSSLYLQNFLVSVCY